jgi:ketosteroid isomerase-like protein
MKFSSVLIFLFFTTTVFAQSADEKEIRESLARQTESWNRGDIEGFMETYWKNDSLMFIGKSGVNWGWDETLANYKKGYPDTTAMGKLSFDLIQLKQISPDYFFVVGKWMLSRSIGDLSGHYNLLFRKINGRWLIVADHSS